jgi:MinD-like ATPase involved in chromosome partitioning or flagellar assembly
MTTTVLCAVRGPAETAVVRALGASGGEVEVTRRCADLAELLAAAAAGLGRVAVISANLPNLDREAVHHLHGSSVRVVALADPGGGWGMDRVTALGVDLVLDQDDAEGAVLRAVRSVAAGPMPDGGPGTSHRGQRDGPLATAPGRPPIDQADPAPAGGPVDGAARGTVIAVWGPTGAPGRTTIAVNLAAELAPGSLLVDADTYGASAAQMVGLLDEAPGVAAAARAAGAGRLDVTALAALTPVLEGGMRILTGLSRADRWPELPWSSLGPLWSAARSLVPWTVVDCGFSVEQDEELSYDTRAPRRNAATLSALGEADVVVVVGGGDPVGLQRLVRALGELADLGVPASRRQVVVNRVRASASGPRPGDAITAALRRYAGVDDVHLVPHDGQACDGALLAGRTLREHAPGSPARKAVATLARRLVPVTAAGAH